MYLYFSAPILNSSTEILSSLSISKGTLLPITGENHGNRRFGFMVSKSVLKLPHLPNCLFDSSLMYIHVFLYVFNFIVSFQVANISNIAIITINFDANSTISRQGTPVSPVAPVTFLYGTCYNSKANDKEISYFIEDEILLLSISTFSSLRRVFLYFMELIDINCG